MPAPNFRRFVISIALALVADQLFIIALTWSALHTPDGAMTLGSVMMVAALARAAGTPLGGFGADRFRPLPTLARVYIGRGMAVGALAAAASISLVSNMTTLHVTALIVGFLTGLTVSPQMAAIPSLVPPARIARGNAIVQGMMQASIVVGPALAGWLLAQWGVSGTWGICAILALLAGLTLSSRTLRDQSLPKTTHERDAPRTSLAQTLRDQPVLLAILVIMGLLYLGLMGPVQVGLPTRVQASFDDDPRLLGLLLGCFGAGMLVGTIAAARVNRPPRVGVHLLAALGITAVGLATVGLATGVPGTVVGLSLAGLGMGYFNITGLSWLHRAVPAAAQGRVLGLIMFSANFTATLSPLWAGWLARDGIDRVFFVGAATVGLACAVSLVVPRLRRLRQASDPELAR